MSDRLIVFDLDGTLVDSRADLAASANHLRAAWSLPPLPEPEVGKLIGHGLHRLVRGLLSTEDQREVERGSDVFRRHYREHCLDRTRLYEGVLETLVALDGPAGAAFGGRAMAVVTNKPKSFTDQILAGLGIAGRFGLVLGADSTPRRKPDPMPILLAMEKLGASAPETLVVGDSDTDVVAGKAAGARTCGVTYGIGDLDVLRASAPDCLIDRFADLIRVIRP